MTTTVASEVRDIADDFKFLLRTLKCTPEEALVLLKISYSLPPILGLRQEDKEAEVSQD